MLNLPCGWDSRHHLIKQGGCGVWVGYQAVRSSPYLLIMPYLPHFHNGIAYCANCIKGFKVKHLGFGVLVRPRDESDDVPLPNLPSLEELYGEVKA